MMTVRIDKESTKIRARRMTGRGILCSDKGAEAVVSCRVPDGLLVGIAEDAEQRARCG